MTLDTEFQKKGRKKRKTVSIWRYSVSELTANLCCVTTQSAKISFTRPWKPEIMQVHCYFYFKAKSDWCFWFRKKCNKMRQFCLVVNLVPPFRTVTA